MELDHIFIKGACEHNLQNVSVKIPKKRLVVLCGVSGSGKSSLAFDTLYAEGQRRYVESLSAYARQFLGQMEKPKYEAIRGLAPTISIEQKTTGSNPRSTVGTITEISDYLRVLYARVGQQHCPRCSKPVSGQSAEQIAGELHRCLSPGKKVLLLAPVLVNRKGEHRELLLGLRQEGVTRLRVDGELVRSETLDALDKRKKHHVEAVIDRVVGGKTSLSRLTESVEAGLSRGGGMLLAVDDEGDRIFSEHLACEACGLSFPELSPQSFSFNSPQGMCTACNGLGTRVEIDPDKVIPNESLSIDQGAIAPWGEDVSEKKTWDFRAQLLIHLKVGTKKPISSLSAAQRKRLLYGTGDKRYQVDWEGKSGKGQFKVKWEGVIPRLMRRFRQTSSERARKWLAQFIGDARCSTCSGARLKPESAAVLVGGQSIVQLGAMTVTEALSFLDELALDGARGEIGSEILKELVGRLGFLKAVGLNYLSLDRPGPTLSGGEAQRIRLASQVGSELSGVIYVLDEPSIGLHQRDNERLLKTLCRMRDIGNTVVCVEHDEDTIRAADHVIDFGPGAGVAGGHIVFSGSAAALEKHNKSLTGAYLSGRRRIEAPPLRTPNGKLSIVQASANNLKDVSVDIPLGVLVCVTGVSGAGKSSLVNDELTPALQQRLSPQGKSQSRGLKGGSSIDRLIAIDQKAIGRTPRSNPITYIKVFDEIRRFFAALPEAQVRGYKLGRFSFNVKGGRCEHCEGDGVRKIEMHFLADVYVRCEQCHGQRYNEATLSVRYRGKSIADVLDLTVKEAIDLFTAHPKIRRPLDLLQDVGLDYLKLGQPSPTLSGGEAQRIKLARELSRRDTGNTLYMLDEPTTGLHFDDINKLLHVLNRLADAGNSVIVIEHNLDVIRCADHVIDMGPDGGPDGGRVIATGSPEEVAKNRHSATGRFLKRALKANPRSQTAAATS